MRTVPVETSGGIYRRSYALRDDGTVWCLPRRIRRADGTFENRKLKELAQRVGNEHGHLRVTLYDEQGNPKHFWVHRLIAEHFVPRRFGRDFVLHGPNGPADNRASQLRWGTRSDNERDKAVHRRLGR